MFEVGDGIKEKRYTIGTFTPLWRWTKIDIELILSELETCHRPIIHICSGCSKIGDIRIDFCSIDGTKMIRNKDDIHIGSPNIKGDMFNIPIKSGRANTVICDPPYFYEFQERHGKDRLIHELVRILAPKGILLLYAPWVYTHPTLKLLKIKPIQTGISRNYYKLLSRSYKSNGQLGDYV